MLAGGMVISVGLVGCTEEHTQHIDENNDGVCDICGEEMGSAQPGEVKMTDGRWYYDAGDGMPVSLKLKEDGSFYLIPFFAENSLAGTWELVEREKSYYKIDEGTAPGEEDEDKTQYTASQTLVLTEYNGTVHEAAYADNVFWNCNVGMGTRTLRQEADYEWKEEDETPIEIVRVSLPKDENANLVLYHDGTFADQTSGYAEGTWEQTSDGYSLKDSDGAAYATVTQPENGTCTYTPVGGTASTLYETAWTPEFTLTASSVDATFAGEDASEKITVNLYLWEDDSADVTVINASYQSEIVLNGTWEDNGDGTVSATFGEDTFTTTAPDGEGNFTMTITIPAGETFASDVTAFVKGEAGASVYAAEVTVGENAFTVESDGTANMLAYANGTFSVAGKVSAQGGAVSDDATFVTGTFDENYLFTYTDAEGNVQTAEPVLNAENKLEVTFENSKIALATLPLPGTITADITVTLGDFWGFLSSADYTAEDVTESYNQTLQVDGGYLYLKDGKFVFAFHSAMQGGVYMTALNGTYTESDGVLTLTAGEQNFTSEDGILNIDFSFNGVPLSFDFEIENKATIIKSSNGEEVPYQTEGTAMAQLTGGTLTMQNGTFTVTFDASAMGSSVPGNAFCEGTYSEEDGVLSFTVTTAGMEQTFTAENGTVTFVYENYMIMGMFSGGTVTFVFDIA